MGKKDPRVDAYVDRAAPFARPVLSHLRTVVHRACPGVEETMKWGFPHFQYKGMLCSMAAFKAHCAFGFWQGKRVLGDEARGGAMGQLGRITSVSDLPSRTALATLVRRAAALNDQGVTAPRTRRAAPRPAIRVPPDLAAALGRDRRAAATFQGLSPSRRRDYLEWITGAKREETRRRRVATAVAWLAEGKSRNWKYERC
jgi:uncharacterized protein YdeI (YjbR/CyaY-like superfamily)